MITNTAFQFNTHPHNYKLQCSNLIALTPTFHSIASLPFIAPLAQDQLIVNPTYSLNYIYS